MGSDDSPFTRRTVLKMFGVSAGIAGLAGCSGSGNGDGGDGGDGGGNGDGGGGDGGGGETTTASGGEGQTTTESMGGATTTTASSDAKNVKITLGGTGGSWGEARAKSFYDPFRNGEEPWTEQHKLEFSATPSEQYTSQLKRSPKNPPFDLVELDGMRANLLGKRGAVANQMDLVDNMENVADAYKSKYMGGTTVFPRGFAYRKDKIDKELNEWDDLIDPDLKGNVSIGSWNQAGSKYFFVINHIKGGSLDNLDPGFEWLKEFVDVVDPKVTTSTDQAMKLWKNGEIYAAPFLSARTDQLRNNQGFDMEFSIPKGGSVMDYWGYPLAKHISDDKKQVGVEFLEGAYDPKTQASFSEAFGYPPATPKSYDMISEEAKEKHPTMILSDDQISRFDLGIDWVRAEQIKPKAGQRWRKIVSG